MIVLDYRDRRPLYEQVTEKLEELMFHYCRRDYAVCRRCAKRNELSVIPILYREPTQN